jgi:hypothetical protein
VAFGGNRDVLSGEDGRAGLGKGILVMGGRK